MTSFMSVEEYSLVRLPMKIWSLTAIGVMLLVVFVLAWFDAQTAPLLAFRRSAIDLGEWWRLYTASWVHFGIYHTTMNVLGLAAIGYLLFWRRHDMAWWIGIFTIPWGVGAGLYFFSPGLEEYRGFSAATYGILATGLILEWRYSRWIMSAAIIILAGKIVYEQLPGYDVNYLRDKIGVGVAIDAHFWGVLSGALVGVVYLIYEVYGKRLGTSGFWKELRNKSPK